MTHEMNMNILLADRCTKNEAERYLKSGTIIYTPDEFVNEYIPSIKSCGFYEGETLEDARTGKLTDISAVTYNDNEYIIVYAH